MKIELAYQQAVVGARQNKGADIAAHIVYYLAKPHKQVHNPQASKGQLLPKHPNLA